MKVLIDQNLPFRTAARLRSDGWDAVHVSESNPRLSDREILAWAAREQRVCVTRDADFHALLAFANATTPSVIRIRIEDLTFSHWQTFCTTWRVDSQRRSKAVQW